MSKQFQIPARTSSKRAFEKFTNTDHIRQLELDGEISSARKKLKPNLSLDAAYFGECARIYDLEAERATLRHKRSRGEFFKNRGGKPRDADVDAWCESEEARRLREKKSALELNAKLYKGQTDARAVDEGSEELLQLRRFMRLLYTTSRKGLAIRDQESGIGERETKTLSRFRDALESACDSRHPDPRDTRLWCPVLNGWIPELWTKAAHIFPCEQGQVAMDNIFGTPNPDRPELHEIENGLLLSAAAEEKIAKGDIVLVPNVLDDSAQQVRDEWSRSNPKQYKIRVLNHTAKGMDHYHPCGSDTKTTWNDLDGQEVRFSSNHRPRARYMYWRYCQSMLRRSWNAKPAAQHERAKAEFGKRFWGTKGPYMRDNMLRAFVREMGHGYEYLVEGADPETASDDEPNPMALMAANNAILRNLREDEDSDDDDDSEDESD